MRFLILNHLIYCLAMRFVGTIAGNVKAAYWGQGTASSTLADVCSNNDIIFLSFLPGEPHLPNCKSLCILHSPRCKACITESGPFTYQKTIVDNVDKWMSAAWVSVTTTDLSTTIVKSHQEADESPDETVLQSH